MARLLLAKEKAREKRGVDIDVGHHGRAAGVFLRILLVFHQVSPLSPRRGLRSCTPPRSSR